MKASVEKIEKNIVKLEIEVDVEKFDEGMEKAYRKNANKFNVPGFRKGKAPRKMVERYYGEQVLYEDAFNYVYGEAYEQAIMENDIYPVDRPTINIIQIGNGQNLIFTAEVTVKPEVELGQYKGIEVEKKEVIVTDDDVENDVEVNLGTGMEGDAETNLDADSNYGKALHSEIKWVRVSPNGRKLVYLSTQGIGIYNIETQESNLVLKQSDDGLTYYIEPTWHPDGNGIIYTKQVIKPGDIHGFEITESGIYYLNLETMEAEKLADGNHGAYIKGKNAIIYERDGMIILKSLEGINAIDNKSGNSSYNNLVNNSNSNDDNNSNNNNNSNNSSNSSNDGNSSTGVALGKNEQVIDQGRFPSVSPCGNYVAYIKTQKNIKKFREDGAANKDNAESKDNTSNKMNTKEGINAEIHETIDNIWIADVSNFENKKQITANFPYYFINETEWLESLEPSELKQVLSINGLYSYYSPVWSSDSRNIYAIRSKNEENSHESRIIKIKLSVNKEEKETIVEKYLQALVLRDEDYAKSLMKNPSELLTLSNPRYVGFKILRSSSESDKSNNERESDMEQKNDKEHEFNKNIEYADAEVYLSYTANPYYMIEISRYYLSSQEDGYIIDRIEPIQNIQVYEKNGVVYLEKELKNQSVTQTEKPVKQEIFRRDDIPAEFIPDGSFRFSCLAYYNTNAEDKEDDTAASKDKNVSLDDTAVGTNEILIFTLQTFDDGQQNIDGKSIKPSVSLLSYSLKDKTFKLIDKISDPSGGIICSNLILSTTGQYAAIDLVQEGLEMRNYTLIYELSSAEKVDITDLLEMQHISENIDSQDDTSTKASASQSINLNSVFWNKNGLVFSARIKQQSMNYIYKPELKKAEAF
jgi:hypothetical protein